MKSIRRTSRPHVRFDGASLSEIAGEPWAPARNDALGYFRWLSCRLAARGRLEPDPDTVAVLSRLIRYFEAIRFWQDEDSGHWEEWTQANLVLALQGMRATICV